MIRDQRNCGADQAFDLLREKALMLGQTLEYTALAHAAMFFPAFLPGRNLHF